MLRPYKLYLGRKALSDLDTEQLFFLLNSFMKYTFCVHCLKDLGHFEIKVQRTASNSLFSFCPELLRPVFDNRAEPFKSWHLMHLVCCWCMSSWQNYQIQEVLLLKLVTLAASLCTQSPTICSRLAVQPQPSSIRNMAIMSPTKLKGIAMFFVLL